ncbi:MAG: ribosome maturation factor RimM [Acidimicrobiales bacterium]
MIDAAPGERPERLEVGRIGKAHGLAGDVAVDLTTDRVDERTRPGAELWVGDRPLVVLHSRKHHRRWLIRFVGVEDRTAAEALAGSILTAVPIDDPDALFIDQLIGCRVIDQHGTDHGLVATVLANPASDLLELENGRLVPLTFVVGRSDGADGDPVLTVDVPAGLLDDES